MPDVSWMRGELANLLEDYWLIRDCIEGSRVVKKNGPKYLPIPSPADQSEKNLARYHAYKQRAVFYNVTDRTLKGMVGQVFLQEPAVELPNELDNMRADIDGNGLTDIQLAQRATHTVLAYARAGLLVDFPTVETDAANQNKDAQGNAVLTKMQLEAADIHPIFTHYNPWDIINWQTEVVGGKRILTLVVLQEKMLTPADDFAVTDVEQWRVLRLDSDGEHYVEIWQKDAQSNPETQTIAEPTLVASSSAKLQKNGKPKPVSGQIMRIGPHKVTTIVPTKSNGDRLQGIPFTFIGSETNDTWPDKPPMLDMAVLNIAHYRNSADYEEITYLVGQPTVWATGLTVEWVRDVLGGDLVLGSRGGIPLPAGANCGVMQAGANTMPYEAMKLKEAQMVALGAKLVQNTKTERTATEVIVETTSESSTLGMIAHNIGAAFEWAFGIACDFMGVESNNITYELNQDYDLTSMSAADRAEVIKEWQSGALAFTEMRAVLKKAGVATLDDADAQATIAKELAAQPQPEIVNPPGADPMAEGQPLGAGGNAGASGAPATGA
jgi:hypothetical protein